MADFRNISEASLSGGRAVTQICGANGSGKTSLLEAIFVLGRGRSFRTADHRSLMRDGSERYRLFAEVRLGDGSSAKIGMERGAGGFRARVNGEPAHALADLARLIPVLLINPDCHRLLEGGPQQRRRFLDWGVFQANHRFLETWKRFRAALRHRNAALRRYEQLAAIRAWDAAFVEAGSELDRLRRDYLDDLVREFGTVGAELLPQAGLDIQYRGGWPEQKTLEESLDEALQQDRRLAQTRVGPHRGDLRITVQGLGAAGRVSRGEQKLIAAALILAQARTLAQHHDCRCILLVDDLPSELDASGRLTLLNSLVATPAQQWMSSIEALQLSMFPRSGISHYRVEAGTVSAMVY